jgi:hypothetical protein
LPCQLGGDEVDDFIGDFHALQVHGRQAEVFPERGKEAFLGDQVEGEQRIAKTPSELVESNQRLEKLNAGNGLFIKEQVPQSDSLLTNGCSPLKCQTRRSPVFLLW